MANDARDFGSSVFTLVEAASKNRTVPDGREGAQL
jgi:hypothetical protein